MKNAVETVWAIHGAMGFYFGIQPRRIDMIALHVSEKMFADDGSRLRSLAFERLDPQQKKAWVECKRKGDRCVRVEIRELPRGGERA